MFWDIILWAIEFAFAIGFIYFFYTLLTWGVFQLAFKPLWFAIQKLKFKSNDFFFTMYSEGNDHLWNGSVACYIIAENTGISLESNTLFPKKIFIPYSDIDEIELSLTYPPRSIPIQDHRDLCNLSTIVITSNTYGCIYTCPGTLPMPYLNRYSFRHNINICRSLYRYLDKGKIKLDITLPDTSK